MEISGRNGLVTGGAHRVGKAIAMMLARAGANVAVSYHTSAVEAERTIAEIEELGTRALAVRCDLTVHEEVQSMAQQVQDSLGGVDIVVNSAGLFKRTPVPMDDVTLWRSVTRASIDGTFYVCNCVAPGMLARGRGVIVNILDLAAWQPWPGYAAHVVAKAGMDALTRQLAVEFSPAIRVNAVAAGPVLPPDGMDSERAEQIASNTLMDRWGDPADVAEAVRFLIEAEYILGEVITVDGGERYGYVRKRKDSA